ncbi:HET domain-containing protein [Fusarium acuminatum]|uniref:HET domain-containing protein n=1 Tax=Fusarium acuminatum TaxID=5515 RepID=A0ABZ2X1S0_9HYPO
MADLVLEAGPTLPSLQPHSCSSCQELLITNDSSFDNPTAQFPYKKVEEKASLGCILFQSLQRKFDDLVRPFLRERYHLILYPFYPDNSLVGLRTRWMITQDGQDEEDADMLRPFASEGMRLHSQRWNRGSHYEIDHPASEFVDVAPLNLDPGSAKSFNWIKKAFAECRNNHLQCNKVIQDNRQSFAMPKRLLDVGHFNEPVLHLFATSDDAQKSYAIASYAWGSGPQAKAIQQAQTTKSNIGSRMSYGLQLSSLPRTIRDLVEVTRRIGHRYLWLDAFCIVQDDPVETKHLFGIMVDFYKRADILISAASASHSDEGFLHPRSIDQSFGSIFKLHYKWNLSGHEGQGSLLFSENNLDCALDNNPLDMRIWPFQEHLVSSRVIIFGSRQIRWKCKEYDDLVDGGAYSYNNLEYQLEVAFSPSSYPTEDCVEKNWRVQAWLELIEDYSRRQYTQPKDRLPAFHETISRLAPLMGWRTSDCVGGIWKSDASRQLLWRKEKPLGLGGLELSRCREYGPSWSWATLPEAVIYDTGAWLRNLGDTVKIIFPEKDTENPTCLVIEGHIQEAYCEGQYFDPDEPRRADENTLLVHVAWDIEMAPQSVFLLDLAPVWKSHMSMGLVLVQVEGYEARFERRGRFEVIKDGSAMISEQLNDDPNNILYSDQKSLFQQVSII